VIVRCGWGRTYGYQMLRSAGFPRRIGDRFRLDTLIAWEQAVLAGEVPGRLDELGPPAVKGHPRGRVNGAGADAAGRPGGQERGRGPGAGADPPPYARTRRAA
jgi:hypothetical protein